MYQSSKYAYVMGDAEDLTLKLWVCAVNPSNGAVSVVEQETNTDPPVLALSPDGKFLFSTFGTYGTPLRRSLRFHLFPRPAHAPFTNRCRG